MQGAEEHLGGVEACLACLTKPAGMKVALTQQVHSCLGHVVVQMTCDTAANVVLSTQRLRVLVLMLPASNWDSKEELLGNILQHTAYSGTLYNVCLLTVQLMYWYAHWMKCWMSSSTGSCWLRQLHGRQCKLLCKSVANVTDLLLLVWDPEGDEVWAVSRCICSHCAASSQVKHMINEANVIWNTLKMQEHKMFSAATTCWGSRQVKTCRLSCSLLFGGSIHNEGLTYRNQCDAMTAQDTRRCKGNDAVS